MRFPLHWKVGDLVVDAHPWVISTAPVFAMSSLEMLQMQQYCSPTRDLHWEVTHGLLRALLGWSYSLVTRGRPLSSNRAKGDTMRHTSSLYQTDHRLGVLTPAPERVWGWDQDHGASWDAMNLLCTTTLKQSRKNHYKPPWRVVFPSISCR